LVDQDTGEYITDLVGVFDLLEKDNTGNIVVVDHKTAAKKPSDSDLDQNLQFSCYGYATRILQELDDRDILLRIDCLVKNKKPVFEQRYTVRTPDNDRKLVKLASDVLNAMDTGVFLPITGWQCGTCQVSSHC